MKNKHSLLLTIFALAFFIAWGQNDPKAKKILDEVSAKTKTYTTIIAEFAVKVENKKAGTSDTQQGKISIKGNKYKLEISNQTVISDGKTSWTVLKDANEVQVNAVDAKQKDGAITPDNIFTIYETGFKYEFAKEEVQKSGAVIQYIKLFPVDAKKRNFHTALLSIDKKKKQITSLKILGKDGNDITYTIKSFVPNSEIADAVFSFNQKAYPGYEVIDLR